MARARKWLADDDGKARDERFFLLYSPVWIAAVAALMLSGVVARMNDVALLAFGIGVWLPLFVVPLLRRGGAARRRPLRAAYWLKFNVWIAIVAAAGSYFDTHFFFDVLGMRYGFPARWHLEARLMGRSDRVVPLFLYPLAHVYFVTYYSVMIVCLRRIRRALGDGRAVTVLAVIALSYAVAFAETLFMANPLMAGCFGYADRGRMLLVGSAAYALIFVVTLPFAYRIDERPGASWTLGRVAVEALAASLIALVLLDLWAAVIGPL